MRLTHGARLEVPEVSLTGGSAALSMNYRGSRRNATTDAASCTTDPRPDRQGGGQAGARVPPGGTQERQRAVRARFAAYRRLRTYRM